MKRYDEDIDDYGHYGGHKESEDGEWVTYEVASTFEFRVEQLEYELKREHAIVDKLRAELSYLHKGPRDDARLDILEFDNAALLGTLSGERDRRKRFEFEVRALRAWISGDRGVTDPNLTEFYERHGVKQP